MKDPFTDEEWDTFRKDLPQTLFVGDDGTIDSTALYEWIENESSFDNQTAELLELDKIRALEKASNMRKIQDNRELKLLEDGAQAPVNAEDNGDALFEQSETSSNTSGEAEESINAESYEDSLSDDSKGSDRDTKKSLMSDLEDQASPYIVETPGVSSKGRKGRVQSMMFGGQSDLLTSKALDINGEVEDDD
tara:strand:- start:124 stop:699 length:576 start_codon:yes stop_codon:yes gene_type:complete